MFTHNLCGRYIKGLHSYFAPKKLWDFIYLCNCKAKEIKNTHIQESSLDHKGFGLFRNILEYLKLLGQQEHQTNLNK